MLSIISRSNRGSLLFKGNPSKSTPSWLMVYIDIFTMVLVMFLFMITRTELETVPPKLAYQSIVADLYQRSEQIKEREGLDWLKVENTLTKGVKLSLDYKLLADKNLFDSAQATINPQLTLYLQKIAALISELNYKDSSDYYRIWLDSLRQSGLKTTFFVRVEGHTDAYPMIPGAKFKDNVELSSFRAYAVMHFLRLYSRLPQDGFMIAGYGSFHPLVQDIYSPENRRVDIYLLPKLTSLNTKQGES